MLAGILKKKLIPVAVIDDVDDAVPLAEALVAGGLQAIEVTLRTDAAIKCMQAIEKSVPDIVIGAGTILEPEIIPQLIDTGVTFGISPGINPRVIEAAEKCNLTLIPGIVTPSELEQARNYGLDILKFFPAEAAGGARMLHALSGPYGHTGIRFIPTGGINISNMEEYLKIPSVAAIGGSWFVARNLVRENKYDEITRLTNEALNIIHETR